MLDQNDGLSFLFQKNVHKVARRNTKGREIFAPLCVASWMFLSIRRHELALDLLFADLIAQAMIVSRADEAGKKRVWLQGLRFQFGVRLSAQEPGVVGELDHLDEFPIGRFT